jgi:hypothetical protein
MNVKELVEQLQSYDPSTMVVIDGYEGGYNEVKALVEIKLRLDAHDKWYYGKHEILTNDSKSADCLAISIL